MNGARITKIIVFAAAIALVIWIASHTYWADVPVPTPLKGEAARNPFYAAQKLAQELGARAQWDRVLITPAPDAVIMVSGWHWSLSTARRESLERWVEAGGRLAVDASLAGGEEEFAAWSGISHDYVVTDKEKEEGEQAETETETETETQSEIPVLRRVLSESQCRTLDVDRKLASDPLGTSYSVCGIDLETVLMSERKAVWGLRDSNGLQALRVNIGKGSVTMINAGPFRYRELFEGDHAKLFVAATQLRPGDAIHFLSEDEHPSLLALMWQYGSPVVLLSLGLVALALWRGGVRFGPLTLEPDMARRSLAEQIRGTGRFALRFGGGAALHTAVLRALSEAAHRRVPGYARLSSDERVDVLARITGFGRDALASAIYYSGSRSSNELRSTLALLEAARRTTAIGNRRSLHGN